MSKRKVSVEDKTYAVNLYLDGKESQRRIADMFDVSLASVQQWIRNYESMGVNAFTLKGNKKYSKELKQQAVLDYLLCILSRIPGRLRERLYKQFYIAMTRKIFRRK